MTDDAEVLRRLVDEGHEAHPLTMGHFLLMGWMQMSPHGGGMALTKLGETVLARAREIHNQKRTH